VLVLLSLVLGHSAIVKSLSEANVDRRYTAIRILLIFSDPTSRTSRTAGVMMVNIV